MFLLVIGVLVLVSGMLLLSFTGTPGLAEESPAVTARIQESPSSGLTPFAADKARRLIRDRYACLGCHQLDGEGGRIGPDLSTVGDRLTPRAVRMMIRDPERRVPGTVMPRQPMTDERLELLVSFLSSGGEGMEQGAPMATPDSVLSDELGAPLYARFCAACHGAEGGGDGFNAQYLPTAPTAHADSTYMSTRPDDTLFDGVHAGGHILGKSHRMPGFGFRLSTDQIWSLVRHIRVLCECEGPAWSRDGRR